MSFLQPANLKSLPGPEDIHRLELPNGITILTRSNFDSPSVVLTGYLPGGSLVDPPEKLGLAHFTSVCLMRGTQQRNFQEVYEALESAGASLGFGASVHNTSFGGRSLTEDLPLLLGLLSEALRQPIFPIEQVERLRGQILTGLSIRDQDTADRADMAFEDIIFPGHPYGAPSDGYTETIQRITRDDLVDFHQKHYGPQGMTLVIVGALAAEQVFNEVRKALGDWENHGQHPMLDLPPLRPLQETARKHIALAGKVQTDLLIGTLGPKRGSPDYMAASLGNNILGQFGMMGRIGDVVREQAGLAYSASTSLNAWITAGTWEVSAGVNPSNLERAITLIFSEIRRFISDPVTAEELQDSKANYIGRLPLSLESNSGVAGALLNLERFQLGLDYYRRYPILVEAVTPEDILETARRYLNPNTFAIVSAGPAIDADAQNSEP
jgi:zinc protease